MLRKTPGAARAVGVVYAGKPVADVVGEIHFLPGAGFIAMQVFVFEATQFMDLDPAPAGFSGQRTQKHLKNE